MEFVLQSILKVLLGTFDGNHLQVVRKCKHGSCNDNRNKWSPIRSVIIRVINKIVPPRIGSPNSQSFRTNKERIFNV